MMRLGQVNEKAMFGASGQVNPTSWARITVLRRSRGFHKRSQASACTDIYLIKSG